MRRPADSALPVEEQFQYYPGRRGGGHVPAASGPLERLDPGPDAGIAPQNFQNKLNYVSMAPLGKSEEIALSFLLHATAKLLL